MSLKSKIEWTENTWNPTTGCTKVSEGCLNCYAERLSQRLQKMGNPKYRNGFEVCEHEKYLDEPLKWKKPSMIFVDSMSDLFHEDISDEFIKKIFNTMNVAQHHVFQVLTKRIERLEALKNELTFGDNIWLGVTVESSKYIQRINVLRKIPASVRFISFEPLLNDVGVLDLKNIDWAIVGGESGFNSRPMNEEWVLNIKNQCETSDTLFYFKQWGGLHKKKNGRILLGKTWDDTPQRQNK